MSWVEENQRLVILRMLDDQNDGRLNETLIMQELDLYGHKLTKSQVRDLLRGLETQDALRVTLAGGIVMIAEITARGANHVARRGNPIHGIAVPSRV